MNSMWGHWGVVQTESPYRVDIGQLLGWGLPVGHNSLQVGQVLPNLWATGFAERCPSALEVPFPGSV